MVVETNCVYIIPPNKDMSILHGTLQLLEFLEPRGLRHPIDFFFRSLAEDQGEHAIGIVLSGTGTEGALGLKAVKGEGGLVLVQDPQTAQIRRHAVQRHRHRRRGLRAAARQDACADDRLCQTAAPCAAETGHQAGDGDARSLQKIFILIRARTGHDFSLYKQNTVVRRIERRMAIHPARAICQQYVVYLREQSGGSGSAVPGNAHQGHELFPRSRCVRGPAVQGAAGPAQGPPATARSGSGCPGAPPAKRRIPWPSCSAKWSRSSKRTSRCRSSRRISTAAPSRRPGPASIPRASPWTFLPSALPVFLRRKAALTRSRKRCGKWWSSPSRTS